MKRFLIPLIATLFFTFVAGITSAQTVIDDIYSGSGTFNPSAPELSTEKIEKISASGRVLILTNNSGSYGKGDFISIVLDDQLVNRAIVGKTANGSGGIKIIKVYSQDLTKVLRPGMEVQIIRGDDSYFNLRDKKVADEGEKSLIEDEENLFDETTLLEDDLNIDENKSREIKTDNIVSLYLAQVEGQDADGNTARFSQISGSYSYQLEDNIWGEVGYGQSLQKDYPGSGLDTNVTSIVLKVKYTVAAPFYSFLQPYAGYQIINADSPGAGTEGDGTTQPQLNQELDLVEDLKKRRVIFGVTLLKRLVPGWFARADIGNDSFNFGFALEF
jgi:hypothetical protein